MLDPIVPPGTPLEDEVIRAMLDLSGLRSGEKHVDLGSGHGRVVEIAKSPPYSAQSWGIEIDAVLAEEARNNKGITVTTDDFFNVITANPQAFAQLDVVTFWFTFQPGTTQLINALYGSKLKRGTRVVAIYDSVGDGKIPGTVWQPSQGAISLGNKIWMYVK